MTSEETPEPSCATRAWHRWGDKVDGVWTCEDCGLTIDTKKGK